MPPYNNIAACLIEQKQFQKAHEILQKAIKIYEEASYENKNSEQFSKVLERVGRVYFLQGEFDSAIEYYKRALLENNTPKTRSALKAVEREKAKILA